MKPDRIALLCRQDKTILEFGRGLFSKAQGLTHQYQYIRHRMREMARFVICYLLKLSHLLMKKQDYMELLLLDSKWDIR